MQSIDKPKTTVGIVFMAIHFHRPTIYVKRPPRKTEIENASSGYTNVTASDELFFLFRNLPACQTVVVGNSLKQMNRGPLVLVDDDTEDQELLLLCLQELGFHHAVKTFKSADAALYFLHNSGERPFLIVSDINMPMMDGIAFKRAIEQCEVLGPKRIPFIFLSTSTGFVKETSNLNIQGYFEKGNSIRDLRETVNAILSYWMRTRHLN